MCASGFAMRNGSCAKQNDGSTTTIKSVSIKLSKPNNAAAAKDQKIRQYEAGKRQENKAKAQPAKASKPKPGNQQTR